MTIDWDLLIITFGGFLGGYALAKFKNNFENHSVHIKEKPSNDPDEVLNSILPIIKSRENIDDLKTRSRIIRNTDNTLNKIYIDVMNNNSKYVWNIKRGLRKKSKH